MSGSIREPHGARGPLRRARTTLAAMAFAVGVPQLARADAIEPPPACPRGQVGVSDHGGARCIAEAPTNCPEGWRGITGGTCVVHTCARDAECGSGKVCVEQSTCMQKRLRRFRHGALDSPRTRARATTPAAFGPPMQPIPLDPPEEYWEPINFCGPGVCGASDQRCEPRKVCVADKAKAQSASIGPDGTFKPPPPKGCAACAIVGDDDEGASLGLLGLNAVLLAWCLRRTRR